MHHLYFILSLQGFVGVFCSFFFLISIATSEEKLFAVLLREKSKIDPGYFNYLALLSQLK